MRNKIKQLFCRHKKSSWYTKDTMFQSLKGEHQYRICDECGKELDQIFLEYEGMGFK